LTICHFSQIRWNYAITIKWGLAFLKDRPSFKNDYLIELFSLCFVHVHYYYARFGFCVCRKMFSYKRQAHYF